MREIKFRGRNPLTKQWEYGFLITVDLSSEKLSKNLTAIIKENAWYEPSEGIGEFKLVEPETVGQFAGLKDLNNKESFEDDLIQNSRDKEVYKIFWHKYRGQWMCSSKNRTRKLSDVINDAFIIGNIHDNPELLEVSNA